MLEEYLFVELYFLLVLWMKGIGFYFRIMDIDEEMGMRNGYEEEFVEFGNLAI